MTAKKVGSSNVYYLSTCSRAGLAALAQRSHGKESYMKKLMLVLTVMMVATAPSLADADVKKEIIDRCRSQMGEYGASMVKACADQDIEAEKALSDY